MEPQNPENYTLALRRLEEIVLSMENNQLTIDELADKLTEAQQLLVFCKKKLTHTDAEVKKILENMQ